MLLDNSKSSGILTGQVELPLSKSLCNRALILAAVSKNKIDIQQISDANDSLILKQALNSSENIIDIEDAGSGMRFLTAFYAFQDKSVELRGSKRMHERPIGTLVNALNNIGASITYLEKEGFPPLQILPCDKNGLKQEVSISAEISSQFISALMLVAPSFPNGLTINLLGKIASRPYIEMTNKMLQKTGVKSVFKQRKIEIPFHLFTPQVIDLEADWSAASYFYAFVAIQKTAKIELTNLQEYSIQGDAIVAVWFKKYFGVSSTFRNDNVELSRDSSFDFPEAMELDFSDYPDLAQTIIVLCACLGISIKATGLESLVIKETNRIVALANELDKLGIKSISTANSLSINDKIQHSNEVVHIKTYNDHRMAMAFSMVSFIRPVDIENEQVVSKSFPKFFDELKQLV